jgi:gas vesicle protein
MADRDNKGDFLVGLLVGGALGAALALLYAPQAGEETRETLKKKGDELKDTASTTYGRVKEQTSGLASQVRESTTSLAANVRESGSTVVGRVRGSSARGEDASAPSAGTTSVADIAPSVAGPEAI